MSEVNSLGPWRPQESEKGSRPVASLGSRPVASLLSLGLLPVNGYEVGHPLRLPADSRAILFNLES